MRIAAMLTDGLVGTRLLALATLLAVGGCAQIPGLSTEEPTTEVIAESEQPVVDPDAAGGADQAASEPGEAANVLPAPEVDESISPYLRNPAPLPEAVQAQFEQAMNTLEQGDTDVAKGSLLALEKQCETCSGVLFNLGLIYRDGNELDSARDYFQRATQANADNLDAWNELGILHREAGEFAEAEQCYQQALSRWDRYPAAHLNLAILYDLYMGRASKALDHYLRYQALTEGTLEKRPQRQLKGWIALLERELQQRAENVAESAAEQAASNGAEQTETPEEGEAPEASQSLEPGQQGAESEPLTQSATNTGEGSDEKAL